MLNLVFILLLRFHKQNRVLDEEVDGGRWGTRHSIRPRHLQAVIDASRALLDSGSQEGAKGLLRAFSSDLATGWPEVGQDMAETRPDAGQNSSEVVE